MDSVGSRCWLGPWKIKWNDQKGKKFQSAGIHGPEVQTEPLKPGGGGGDGQLEKGEKMEGQRRTRKQTKRGWTSEDTASVCQLDV